MAIWRFSDGTTVRLGGEVEGASLFAQELRRSLLRDDVIVSIWGAGPAAGVKLDRHDPTLLDAWLRGEMERPYRRSRNLKLLERPTDQLGELPPDPRPPLEAGDLA